MDTVLYLANKIWDIVDEENLQDSQEVIDFLDNLNEISIRG